MNDELAERFVKAVEAGVDLLRIIAAAQAPLSPDHRFPLESFSTFDFSKIGAKVILRDRTGPLVLEWNGYTFPRRIVEHRQYGKAVMFSRPVSDDDTNNDYYKLIKFVRMDLVEIPDGFLPPSTSPTPHQAPPQLSRATPATTSAATPAKTTAPVANGGKGDNDKELLKRKALAAIDEQMFFEDAAAYFGGVYTSPVLQKTMLIFCEKFELSLKEAIFAGLDAYITKRTELGATDRETAHLNAAAAADKAFGGFQVPS